MNLAVEWPFQGHESSPDFRDPRPSAWADRNGPSGRNASRKKYCEVVSNLVHSYFGFVSDFVFRISDFATTHFASTTSALGAPFLIMSTTFSHSALSL